MADPRPGRRRPALPDGESIADLRVLVVGTGLIGTSVGLALRPLGTDVLLVDRRPAGSAAAAARGAGRVWRAADAAACADRPARRGRPDRPPPSDQVDRIDHVVLAVPPREIGSALVTWQRRLPGATFSDTGSVKVRPLVEAESLGADMSAVCGAHPIAGRERSGPEWATIDLFAGRPWVITPGPGSSARAVRHARLVAAGCGANVVEMDAESHDIALGLLSHLPHLMASAFAGRLAAASDEVVRLAGPGLWDFTRIAGANADLWTDIVAANATPIASLLAEVVADLDRVRDALAGGGPSAAGTAEVPVQPAVEALFRLGNTGRERLEAVRGGAPPAVAHPLPAAVPVAVPPLVPLQEDPRTTGAATRAPEAVGGHGGADHAGGGRPR